LILIGFPDNVLETSHPLFCDGFASLTVEQHAANGERFHHDFEDLSLGERGRCMDFLVQIFVLRLDQDRTFRNDEFEFAEVI
jgi:hypothetical protein